MLDVVVSTMAIVSNNHPTLLSSHLYRNYLFYTRLKFQKISTMFDMYDIQKLEIIIE